MSCLPLFVSCIWFEKIWLIERIWLIDFPVIVMMICVKSLILIIIFFNF